MHISIGAAILILGLLFLATSKAGLKVLGVLGVAASASERMSGGSPSPTGMTKRLPHFMPAALRF